MERSDYSRYVDGRYVGHAYREARAALAQSGSEGGDSLYSGEVYILEESLHDLRAQTRQLDQALPERLVLASDGTFRFDVDPGIPSLRGLPALPDGPLAPDRYWTCSGDRALDLDADGKILHLPFLAECRFIGEKLYAGQKAFEIASRFATRYAADASPASGSAANDGQRSISAATGTHELDILVDAQTRWPLFIRDRFDETFSFQGGGSERRSGFTLVFFEGATPLDRAAAVAAIRRGMASVEGGGSTGLGSAVGPVGAGAAAGTPPSGSAIAGAAAGTPPSGAATESVAAGPAAGVTAAATAGTAGAGSAAGTPPSGAAAGGAVEPGGAGPGPLLSGAADKVLDEAGVELGQSSAGIVLRVRDLHFVADSDEILPSDLWRLDAIAAALKALPGRSFLVEGHSASTGNPSGELELSQSRAKRVADELAARGIEAGRFMYKGYGSSRPIAPNDSDEGRARNRRVEITVLDY